MPSEEEVRIDSTEANRRQKPDSTLSEELDTARPTLRFICRDIGQGLDNPLYEVSLLVGNAYYTLDTIHTCSRITYSDYEEFEIPNYALSACGGWWKNAGDYFFAYEDAGDIVVMHAWQTEEQSVQGYFYKEAKRLKLPEPEVLEQLTN